MRPMAITLNYSVKNIQNNVCIIIYEKSQFNSIVWGSLHKTNANNIMCYTLTSHSSILRVALQTVDSRSNFRAVSKVSLSASAANNMQMNSATASTKVGITEGNCICWIECSIAWNFTERCNWFLVYSNFSLVKGGSSMKLAYSFYCRSYGQNSNYIRKSESVSPWVEYPSCRHTTEASILLQPSSHTVPHTLFIHISTLPSFGTLPPTNRRGALVHGATVEVYQWD